MKKLLSMGARGVLAGILVAISTVRASGAQASPVSLPGGAPAESRWILHFDAQRAREGVLLREFLKNGTQIPENRFAKFRELTNLDLATDVDALTLFGRSPEGEDAVAVLNGRFDAAKLIALAGMNAGYETIPMGERQVHSWMQKTSGGEQKKMYGVLQEDGTLLMISGAMDALQKALDPAKPAPGGDDLPLSAILQGVDAPLVVAFSGMGNVGGEPRTSRDVMMRQIESGLLTVSEVKEDVIGRLELLAGSEEATLQMFALAQGFLAMARMRAAQEMPQIRPLLEEIKLRVDGRRLTLEMSTPAENVIRQIREASAEAGAEH